MTTFKQHNDLGEELEKLLILRTSPLAVKMLEQKSDIPEGGGPAEKGPQLPYCPVSGLCAIAPGKRVYRHAERR